MPLLFYCYFTVIITGLKITTEITRHPNAKSMLEASLDKMLWQARVKRAQFETRNETKGYCYLNDYLFTVI